MWKKSFGFRIKHVNPGTWGVNFYGGEFNFRYRPI